MDSKAILANKRKINELAIQHNKLTTLVGALLNELNGIKKELRDVKSGNVDTTKSNDSNKSSGSNSNKYPNFTFNSAPKQSIEQYDFAKGTATIETKEVNPETQSISLDTDNTKGIIKLLFYF